MKARSPYITPPPRLIRISGRVEYDKFSKRIHQHLNTTSTPIVLVSDCAAILITRHQNDAKTGKSLVYLLPAMDDWFEFSYENLVKRGTLLDIKEYAVVRSVLSVLQGGTVVSRNLN